MDDEKTKDLSKEIIEIEENDDEEPTEEIEEVQEESEEEVKEEKKKVRKKRKITEEDIEEIEEQLDKDKKHNVVLIVLIVILFLLCLFLCIFLIVNKKKNNEEGTTPKESKIVRPENIDYSIVKQSYFGVNCKQTIKGEKYKTLSKNLVIDCTFGYEVNSNQMVKELYFDLNNSANVKLKETKNNSEYELLNEGNTYKLVLSTPSSVLNNDIHFYFEVLNDTDESGFVEVANIIFKDSNEKYYKVMNSIETFPPEYDDKIYIFKESYEDDDLVYYFSSKQLVEGYTPIATFQCKNETCDTLGESSHYLLILDDKLLIYDILKKTTTTIDTPEDIKYEDYSYEMMNNQGGNLYGIAFKKNYKSAYDCENADNICINTGITGYELGYYSLKAKAFTIALDYGIIGSSAYSSYDVALMLYKDGKFGVYSLEDDNMMLEFSSKYKSIDYDDETENIMLEVYDKDNNEYYFEYYDPVYASFTIDTEKLEQYEPYYDFYYAEAFNRNAKKVQMFFDKKGNPLKNIPYALRENVFVNEGNIVLNRNNFYNVYDGKGNFLYKTKLAISSIEINSSKYVIAKDEGKFVLYDIDGNFIVDIQEAHEGTELVSIAESPDGKTIFVILDPTITEENKNAYIYTIETNKIIMKETTHVDIVE